MLEKSFGIFFFLKKPKTENADGMRYVYLRMTIDGVSKEISTKRLWHPSRWNVDSGKALGSKEESKMLNSFLESFTALVYQAKQKLIDAKVLLKPFPKVYVSFKEAMRILRKMKYDTA